MIKFFKYISMGFATIGEGFYIIASSINPYNTIKSYDDVKKRYEEVRKKYEKLRGVKND